MSRKQLMLLCALLSVFLLTACNSDESPTPSDSTDPASATPAVTQSATPEPTASPTPEPTATPVPVAESDHWRESYQNPFEITGNPVVTISENETRAAGIYLSDAGWQSLAQSVKSINGKILAVDDHRSTWVLVLDGARSSLGTYAVYQYSELYTAPSNFPTIADACINGQGIFWVEHSASKWQLKMLPEGQSEPVLLESGSIIGGGVPSVSSTDDSIMVLYAQDLDSDTTYLRAWDGQSNDWHPTKVTVHTRQKQPPVVVGTRVSWVEETNAGWGVATYDFATDTQQLHIFDEILKPRKVSSDGQLVFIQTADNALYVYDMQDQSTMLINASAIQFCQIPGDGALVAVQLAQVETLRYQHYGSETRPAKSIFPLGTVTSPATVLQAYHHSYEMDVEMFFLQRGDTFEQMTVSIKEK